MLGKHEKTESGRFRKERRDSLVKNLKEEYSELNEFHGNTKLGSLLDEYGVDSLSQLLKELKK